MPAEVVDVCCEGYCMEPATHRMVVSGVPDVAPLALCAKHQKDAQAAAQEARVTVTFEAISPRRGPA